MKIAIDCRSLLWKHSGIARYLYNVLLELSKQDRKNEYYLLCPVDIDASSFKFNKSKKIVFNTNELAYKFLETPIFLQKEKVQVYWSPTQDLPLWKPKNCKYIVTIHDGAMEHDMAPYSLKVKLLHSLGLYSFSAKLADTIFTDSNFSKKDISNVYHIPGNKIIVTYLGIDSGFKKLEKDKAVFYIKNHFSITSPYIFMVNTGRPRNVIDAFKELCKSEWKNNPVQLIILGKSVKNEQVSSNSRVKYITEFVSDKELNNLYSGAEFFISASFYEGFGLTPGEALKSGTPILISNLTALPEIYEYAALYCNPHDIKDIKSKLKKLFEDKKMQNKILFNSNNLLEKYKWKSVAKVILESINTNLG